MEKKQHPAAAAATTTAASPPQGVCERLFNAFNLHSTFPTVRRLTFRQQEAVGGGVAAPAPLNQSHGKPSSPEKKHLTPVKPEPSHVPPQKEVHEKKAHEAAKPQDPKEKEKEREKEREKVREKKEEKAAAAAAQPAPVSLQKGASAPVPRPIALAQETRGAAADGIRKAEQPPPANNHQDPDQLAAKHRKGINEKVDDYITRAKTKMRSSGTMLRAPTSKQN